MHSLNLQKNKVLSFGGSRNMAIAISIRLSQLEGQKRIDAEYYQPEYSRIRHILNQIKTRRIKELSTSVVSFGAYSLCNYIVWREKGVPYLNVENIRDGHMDLEGVKYIDEDVHEILKKSQVKEGQIILTMAGTIGNAAVAYKLPPKVNSNQATAKITLKPSISPFFVTAFLNSYFGRKQTEWEIVTSVQPNIFLWQIKEIKVPIISKEIENEVEKVYKQGLNDLEHSKSLYTQAEDILLRELKLREFNPKYELAYTTNLSRAFRAQRIDAEYFQPAYHSLIEFLKKNYELKSLKKLILGFQKGVEVGHENYKEEGKQFIRVSNLSTQGFVERDQRYISEELYQKLKNAYEPKINDLLLTKDATPGIAYVIKEPIDGVIASGILRLTINESEINNEYLAFCINSIIGAMQIARDGGGSVITHWRPEQIKQLQIPILPEEIQQKIASLVRQSHETRRKAKELLEEAKRKIQEVIEKKAAK